MIILVAEKKGLFKTENNKRREAEVTQSIIHLLISNGLEFDIKQS
jgi:hypothetical protein